MSNARRDRRRSSRVLFGGRMRWQCGVHVGECDMLDLSPGGVSFSVPQRDARRIDGRVKLHVELTPGMTWQVAEAARVVRITLRDPNTCRVCVAFPADGDES